MALDRPIVRIGATCEQVLPDSVDGWFSGPVDEVVTESTPITSLAGAAALTVGSLDCSRRVFGDSLIPTEYVTFEAIPDGAEEFADELVYYVDDGYTVFDSVGDSSAYYCNSYDVNWGCTAVMLVGVVWVRATIQVSTAEPLGDDTARERMHGLLVTAAAVLRNSQPSGPRYVAPADAVRGSAICDDDERVFPIVSSAFGIPDPFHYGYDTFFAGPHIVGLSDSGECGFASESDDTTPSLSISTLPGGAWWAEDWADKPPEVFGTPLRPVEVPGVVAYVGCRDTYCMATVVGGGSAFEVWSSSMTEDELVAGLAAFPELLAA